MDQRVAELEVEVDTLRSEVSELRSLVHKLKREFERGVSRRQTDSEADRGSSYSSVLDSPLRGSSASFSLVTGGAADLQISRSPSVAESGRARVGSDSRSSTGYGAGQSRSPEVAGSGSSRPTLTWAEREVICDEIAEWFLRCLRGQHRGSSGRDRIPLSSRVWIVAKDFDGFLYRPCQVFHSFSECKSLVKRGSECGEAVFIGVPSEREARRIVASANLGWPFDQ